MRKTIPLLLLLLFLAPLVAACSQTGKASDHTYRLAPLSQMPHEVRQMPASVRHAYQFAYYNKETLQELPCTCGCAAMGHMSNYDCYVSGEDARRLPVYDPHALECRICVDITQDAMHMLDEGQTIEEIYTHVIATYGDLGPATPLN